MWSYFTSKKLTYTQPKCRYTFSESFLEIGKVSLEDSLKEGVEHNHLEVGGPLDRPDLPGGRELWSEEKSTNQQPTTTLLKLNMEPENDGFQKESPFPGGWFSGSMLNFRGVGGTPPRKLEKMDPFLTSILFRWVEVSTNQPDSYTTRVLKSSRSGAFFWGKHRTSPR